MSEKSNTQNLAGNTNQKVLIENLLGSVTSRKPIWMMRQAGRHLPEYRDLRSRNKSFLDFCYAPAAASEATLQPVRRYDIDAAIIFSDILVVPHALGQWVDFKEGIGPVLEPIQSMEELLKLNGNKFDMRLAPVYEAIDRVKGQLDSHVALLGFCGAPWTISTYIIQGKGGNREFAKIFAIQNPEFMEKLFEILIEYCAKHLANQIDAGADAVQIFESWAEDLNDYYFQKFVIEPNQKIVKRLREIKPDAKIIGFPRGASHRAKYYYPQTGVNAISLDTAADIKTIRQEIGNSACIQGNLDPVLLLSGDGLEDSVKHILNLTKDTPHIFNLGHGVLPKTPIENVEKMIKLVRENS